MDIAKLTAEVDELVEHARMAYDSGSIATANVLLQTAQSKLPNHVGAKKLEERMRQATDKEKSGRKTKQAVGDLGSTDHLGLGTFVTTKSAQPPPKDPEKLAPWEGGIDPFQPGISRIESSTGVPTEEATNTKGRKKTKQNQIGDGIDMPVWMRENTPMPDTTIIPPPALEPEPPPKPRKNRGELILPIEESAVSESSSTTVFSKKRDAAYQRSRTNQTTDGKIGNFFAKLPLSPFRLGMWIAALLFCIVAVVFCLVRFSPTAAQTPPMGIPPDFAAKVDTLVRQGYLATAASMLQNEIAKNAESLTTTALNIRLAQILELQATEALREARTDDAIRLYQEAAKRNPESLSHHVLLANAIYTSFEPLPNTPAKRRKLDEAMQHISIALELDPQSTQSLYLGGKIAGAQGNTNVAKKFEQDYRKFSSK